MRRRKRLERLLGAAGHVVWIAEPHRPARRRAAAAEPEQPPDGLAEQLALEIVQRRVERRPRGELARRHPLHHVLERERIVSEQLAVLLDVRQRRGDRLAVAVDGLRLAETGDSGVPQLDDDDVLAVARATGDDERLRQLERDGPGGDVHGRNVPTGRR